jgi:hypothetical protein
LRSAALRVRERLGCLPESGLARLELAEAVLG